MEALHQSALFKHLNAKHSKQSKWTKYTFLTGITEFWKRSDFNSLPNSLMLPFHQWRLWNPLPRNEWTDHKSDKYSTWFAVQFIFALSGVRKIRTSNSSQNPCFTLSIISAGLLSSLTRLSISAALIRVVLSGCGDRNNHISHSHILQPWIWMPLLPFSFTPQCRTMETLLARYLFGGQVPQGEYIEHGKA